MDSNNKHDQTCSCYGVVESTTPCRFYHPYWHQTAIHIAICELVWRVCCDVEEFMFFQCLPKKNGRFLWYIYSIYIGLLLYTFCTCHFLATSPNKHRWGRVLLSRRPRFMKEGALFNPGVEASGPGPGSYDSDKAYGLGTCKLSTLDKLLRWEETILPVGVISHRYIYIYILSTVCMYFHNHGWSINRKNRTKKHRQQMNTWMRIGGAGCVWSWGTGR